MSKLYMRGSRILDPATGRDEVGDLWIEDGKIVSVVYGQASAVVNEPTSEIMVLDCTGLVLAPGLIDMHVHLRDPGFIEKEDIFSGCAAAAAGGFTSVACMPNTKPVCDSPEVVTQILEKGKLAKARIYPVAAITRAMDGAILTDLCALKEAGARAVSDDGKPVENNRLLLQTLCAAQEIGLPVLCHAEDLHITGRGIMHEGEISRRIQAPGVDRASEDVSTAQAIALAAASNTAVHICHVSTAGSLALIRDAKRRGVRVTCETAPHYFTLTHEKLLTRDANFRMAPPLREESDREAVLEAISDGTVDCIATDHAPHTQAQKADFNTAPNGVVGLETSLALGITQLVRPGVISLMRLMELMSTAPAGVLGVEGGAIKVGAPADLVLFAPDECWIVDKERFHSKGRNTCFDRFQVVGRVRRTILNGETVYENAES